MDRHSEEAGNESHAHREGRCPRIDAPVSPLRAQPAPAATLSEADFTYFYKNPSPARLAGQDAKARSIIDRLKSQGAATPDFTKVPTRLDALVAAGPTEFDMLWGASFATGDPRYCSKILTRFAGIAKADGNAEDILTIAKAAETGADSH